MRSPVWEIITVKILVVRIASLPIAQMPTLKFKAKRSFHQDFLAPPPLSNYQSSPQSRQSNSLSLPRSASLTAERPHCKDTPRGYTSLILTIGGKRNVNVLRKRIELRATSIDVT